MKAQVSIEVLVTLLVVMLFALCSIAFISGANSHATEGLAILREYSTSSASMVNYTEGLCSCIFSGYEAMP